MSDTFSTVEVNWRQNRKYLQLRDCTNRNTVRTPKWGHRASRMYTTSTDSGRHHCTLNMHTGGQQPEVVIT